MPAYSAASVSVVIPVLNEAHVLEKSICRLRVFLCENVAEQWEIVVVDNGSSDGTDRVAQELARTFSDVRFLQLPLRGRGRALRTAWLQSTCDVMCYMDVDLSTELKHLPELIHAVLREGYDVATGSRLMLSSHTRRSFKREFISRAYNLLVKVVLFTKFSDAQCGFKAISREVAERVVPDVEDQSWFFDTELLVLSEKYGFRIKDIPVAWIEDDDSRVKIFQTAWDDIKGVARVRWQLWTRRLYHPAVAAARRR